MYEDESYTLMIAKNKGLWPDQELNDICSNSDRQIFKYLSDKYLNTPINKERFACTVKDFYCMAQEDYLEETGEVIIPSHELISDLIDEENMNIITLFLLEDKTKADNIVNIYTALVSPNLSYSIKESLNEQGLPFRDSNDTKGRVKITRQGFCDPYQIIMFGDELYD